MALIESNNITTLYVPFYTCIVVLQAIKYRNCSIRFYNIDNNLDPILPKNIQNEWILYINYFGLKNETIQNLSKIYKNLIIDNSQGFFATPSAFCFYSPRKFVGVSDGGIVYGANNFECANISHFLPKPDFLINRITYSASFAYNDFKNSESFLDTNKVFLISKLSQKILNSLNFNIIKKTRYENYIFLHKHLSHLNNLTLDDPDTNNNVPLCYAFLKEDTSDLRNFLIKNNIFVPMYWQGIDDFKMQFAKDDEHTCDFEVYLSKNILPLPIDQRYGIDEMKIIVDLVLKYVKKKKNKIYRI